MRIYIQTDIEGIAGWCFFDNPKDQSIENYKHRERMRKLLTAEVNAAVSACYDAGADDVIVHDNHGSGYNIFFEDLDSRCRIVHGKTWSSNAWMPKLDISVDRLILIGMHAMCGTEGAVCPHSKVDINNGQMFLSEATAVAACAGDCDVPLIFASGDDKTIAEILEKISGIEYVITKEALSPYMACSIMPAMARELIYAGVKKGIQLPPPPPFKIPGPVTVGIIDSEGHVPPFARIGEPVTLPTFIEAMTESERRMPWTCLDTKYPDGYVYPS